MTQHTTIAALYHFSDSSITDIDDKQNKLKMTGEQHQIKGTLLLAPEGINGTIAGKQEDIEAMLKAIESALSIQKLIWKKALFDSNPFYRFKVKIKKEIVTLGKNSQNVSTKTGQHVSSHQWNELINDPETIVIDTRNDYETAIGTFPNAIDPQTKNFRDFPDFVSQHLSDAKDKKIAMYCTGGIRCEKASNYLLDQGYQEVYQLQGGILQYFEDMKEEENLWQGECFVFDNRVSVNKNIQKGIYDQCFACRKPITQEDKNHSHYREGISCHHCYETTNETQKQRYQQRQLQQQLAKKRGQSHIGPQTTDK